MDRDAIERAQSRVSLLRDGAPDPPVLNGVLERTRAELAALAEVAAQLQSTVPELVRSGLQEAMHEEVLPVARHLAEVRGLSAQQIRRLECVQEALESERQARIADLDVLVDLLAASWEGLDSRLGELEARLGRLEGGELPEAPVAHTQRLCSST